MRTLQEKYNAIQVGKFSKEHFLAEARMQQPQLITRFNGYDDAVQILKNKGMIQEATSNTRKVGDKVSVYGTNKSTHLYSGEILSIDGDNITVGKFSGTRPSTGESKITVPSSRVKSGKDLSIKEARLTNKSLTDYRYKPTNDMDKYPYEQILRGLRVELETMDVFGTPTPEEYAKALAKVSKNLAKDSIYYTNQLAGVSTKVDLHDKMVDATAKNTVDTFNGMKKAQLKEGFKKLIKKVLSETVVDVEDYNGEDEFDMYGDDEADDIPHPRGYEDQDEIDYDDENFSDPFIDGDLDESKMSDVHILAQEAGTLKDFLLSVKAQHPEVDLRRDIEELQHIWNNREQDEVDYDDIDITPDNIGDPGYKEYESPSDRMYNSDAWVQAQRDMMEGNKSEKELRAEWEKYQATCHPEDRMSYMEWRSEQGLDEAVDTEADKNMVRKFMTMYETEPSKFERLHKQAKVQASTTQDIKHKHLLSLINRAKAGALQKSTPEIPGFEGTRDALDNLFESVSLFDILDENYETDPYDLNDKTDYRKMGAEAFYHRHKKRNQNPYPLDSPAGIDWDKGWDKAQSAESDSYKGY